MPTEAAVAQFWESETCGVRYATSEEGTLAYYREIEDARYSLEPFIRDFADFARWRGRRVLEVGVGAATDFVNFARAGAIATGVDLTSAAVEHARRRLELEGLGADLRVADAEELPFPDGAFDLVYSWGVIHHATHPERVVAEIRRVLAPGGQARVMLYGRRSWVAFGLWLRYGLPARSPSEVIAARMESPGTRAYTADELVRIFRAAGFSNVRVAGFPTPWDRRVAGPLARLIRLDWFLGVVAA
jgi:ubiquinone/menaquinone biosynthesis C-methylase UbiE